MIKRFKEYLRQKIRNAVLFDETQQQISSLYFYLNNSINISEFPKATGNLRYLQENDTLFLQLLYKIFQKKGWKIWLFYGTLLGAERHKDFIPWDDDLDIAMLNDDYIEMKEELPSIFSKISPKLKLWPNLKWMAASYNCGLAQVVCDIYPCLRNEENGKFYIVHHPDKLFSEEQLFPLKLKEFGNFSFPTPNNTSDVLNSLYGNYMQYPNKRLLHHGTFELFDKNIKENKITDEEIKKELLEIINKIDSISF